MELPVPQIDEKMAALMENRSRRLRIYLVSEWLLVDFLLVARHWPQRLSFPEIIDGPNGPPDDAEIVSVHSDYSRRALAVTFRHQSFDPVPDGEMIPVASDRIALTIPVELVRQDDGSYRRR